MSAYEVHAYTIHGTRVATVKVRALRVGQVRGKARAALRLQGRQPDRLTLVPVQLPA